MLKSIGNVFVFILMYLVVNFNLAAIEQRPEKESLKTPLTIAINETSYPYHFLDKHGEADGLMADFWRLWAKKQQVDIKFVTLPWLETLSQVSSGEVDIHAGLSILESRKKLFAFSKPLFPLYGHLYVNVALTNIEDMTELKPYLIGVVKGSAHIEMLQKKFPYLKQKMYEGRHELYKAALNKEILVFTGLEKLSSNYQYYQQLIDMYPPYKRIRYQQANYGVAVAKHNENLHEVVAQGLEKISVEERLKIERKWFGIEKNKDSLLVAFAPKYPPYSELSSTGKPQGLLIDFWRLWSKQTGQKIEFIARDIVDRLTLIEQQNVDVFLTYPKDRINTDQFELISPIYNLHVNVYVSNRIKGVESLHFFEVQEGSADDAEPNVVGIWQEALYEGQLLAQYPNLNLRSFPTVKAMIQAAELGEIDAMISSVDTMTPRLIKDNFHSAFYSIELPSLTTQLSSLIDKDNPQLMSIINEGFAQIELKKLAQLENHWLSDEKSYYRNLLEKVILTEEEKHFILKNNKFKVGVLNSNDPIGFYNEHGVLDGIDRDILNLVSKRTGLKLSYQSYNTWNQLLESMLAGEIDMITSITPTEDRKTKMLFTQSYWQTPWVVLHPQHFGKTSTLSSFHGQSLAIIKGYYLIDFLREHHPQITLKVFNHRKEALIALRQGQVQGFVEIFSSASELLKQESLVSLAISIIESIPTDKSHFGVQKNNPLLIDILEKGIASISDQEKSVIHDKWFSININTGFDKDLVKRVAVQVTLLIIIILSVIMMWNRRLRAEVTQRKRLEEQMKYMATHDDLTGLANRVLLKDRINTAIELHQRQSLLMAVLFLDLDGFKSVNDNHGHDVGDELLLLVANRLQTCVRKSDTVVRFGGDEFVLLLTGLHHSDEAIFVADKVLYLLQSPFELSSTKVQIGCSIGVAIYPNDGNDDTELLKTADALMYQVKSSGKNGYLMST